MSRADKLGQVRKKREYFSDFTTNFARHPASGDVSRVTNEESIKQALKNLILTNLGEKPFEPTFGGDVRRALFEGSSAFPGETVSRAIRDAIQHSEPRVLLQEVRVRASPDTGEMRIAIEFSLINDPTPISLDVVVKRVR